ncbi:hypothetical protein LMG24235_04538 [Paraburkholderia sabiae]|nr:hypothetical protein LMG24235_04538 [Paraburkholderia sabiae]
MSAMTASVRSRGKQHRDAARPRERRVCFLKQDREVDQPWWLKPGDQPLAGCQRQHVGRCDA